MQLNLVERSPVTTTHTLALDIIRVWFTEILFPVFNLFDPSILRFLGNPRRERKQIRDLIRVR